jgi:hypothetical protein
VTGIGRYEFANDITDEEIRSAIHWLAGARSRIQQTGSRANSTLGAVHG